MAKYILTTVRNIIFNCFNFLSLKRLHLVQLCTYCSRNLINRHSRDYDGKSKFCKKKYILYIFYVCIFKVKFILITYFIHRLHTTLNNIKPKHII